MQRHESAPGRVVRQGEKRDGWKMIGGTKAQIGLRVADQTLPDSLCEQTVPSGAGQELINRVCWLATKTFGLVTGALVGIEVDEAEFPDRAQLFRIWGGVEITAQHPDPWED